MLVVVLAGSSRLGGVLAGRFLFLLGNGRMRGAGPNAAAHFLAHEFAVAQA